VTDGGARGGLGDARAEVVAVAPPDAAVDLPTGPDLPVDATARRGPLPIVVPAVLVVLFLAAAWFAARRGVITDTWPAFLPGTDSTSITRYSGPWLTAAAAAVLGAGVSVLALVRGLTARAADRR
jgi:hypothetical protein